MPNTIVQFQIHANIDGLQLHASTDGKIGDLNAGTTVNLKTF